jgi:hypothetical protein
LRLGFAQVERTLRSEDELHWDITSILADNRPARRILCAGLPGLPKYRHACGFNTLVYRTGGSYGPDAGIENGEGVGLGPIADCLIRNYRRYQCAPVWDESALTSAGLGAEDFLVLREGERVGACVAIWDQRKSRQTVVRGYRAPLGLLRPLVNLTAPLAGLPVLPPSGQPLAQAFLSHLSCDGDDPGAMARLLRAALAEARRRGLGQLLLGLADGHPLLPGARALRRHLSYRSDMYSVHWGPRASSGEFAAAGPIQPELATL